MGGVGKTLLASHVRNEIKRRGTFRDVYWVTVTQNFNISKLRHDIAKKMGVKLDDEDNEGTRAEDLSSALEAKVKLILILDDVWKYIDLKKVGIPLRVNGIKVILTTRLKHVCQQMDCPPDSMITMEPLDCEREEDWELFLQNLGPHGTPETLSLEIEEIARSIVEICGGLPLVINVMARIMKQQLNDIFWWKYKLNNLKKGEMGEEMEEEVLNVLKRSYDNLMDKETQSCFLYCAMLPDSDTTYKRNRWIMKLVDQGLINGMKSLEEIFDEGNTILGKLEAHSLLEIGWTYSRRILMRALACYIIKSHRDVMFKQGLPLQQEWIVDLEMVYLIGNSIKEIPGDMSPCMIHSIPECFFIRINSLTALDLSRNESLTCLPNSLSSLRSLVSLVLNGCLSLEYVPPLRDLQALSRLDISVCQLKEAPQGLEKLINWKWLDLSFNKNLTFCSGSLISGLTNLQYLDLRNSGIEITAEDVQGMKMLECFGGTFLNRDIYNQFVIQILNSGFGPKTFYVTFGSVHYYRCSELKGKFVHLKDREEFPYLLLPRAFDELRLWDSNQWICSCDGLSYEGVSSFSSWKINISTCERLKSLFCLADSCSSCKFSSFCYSALKRIDVEFCPSIKEIFADAPRSFSHSFSGLKYLYIFQCHAMEKLLTPGTGPELQNLERIVVHSCDSIKEIFAMSNNDDDEDDSSIIKLPNLTNCSCILYLN